LPGDNLLHLQDYLIPIYHTSNSRALICWAAGWLNTMPSFLSPLYSLQPQ